MSILLVIWAVSILLVVATTVNVLFKVEEILNSPSSMMDHPKITILKPLKGVEDGLEENLESFFNLMYPRMRYRLVFCTASSCDPAIDIIIRLAEKYPGVHVQLNFYPEIVGANPKINNIYCSYRAADTDLILISDSSIKVDPFYLQSMLSRMKDGIGVVTGTVIGENPKSFAGEMESIYLNTFVTRAMFGADTIGFPAVMGKSMLFRKSDCEKFGGLKALSNYLAEDYMMGQKMREIGLKIAIARTPVKQNLGDYSLKTFFNRHLRWGRMRKAHSPIAFLFEPLTMPFVTGVIGASYFSYSQLFLWSHMCFFFALDILVMGSISENPITAITVCAWAFRELVAFPLWVYSLCGSKIDWKGNKLKLKMGGRIERI